MTAPHVEPDPHGGIWCEQHRRRECSKPSKRSRERCHNIAISGRNACKNHVGESTELAKAKGEAAILAWNAQAGMELEPMNPGLVVLSQLRVAVMRADYLGERLRMMVEVEADQGLVGSTYALGREGQKIEMGEAARGMARLEAEWRDRSVRFAKAAHDMGIAQATLELEQGKAQIVVRAFLASLAVLKLPAPAHDLALETFLGAIERAETLA